ncbi:MAG: hypothetical protein R2681_06695 [Pyrinomonadaceae bacterium]
MNSHHSIDSSYSFFKNSGYFSVVSRAKVPARILSLVIILLSLPVFVFSQTYQPYYQGMPQGERAFQQEIARLEITVERAGEIPLPITLVPRVEKDDLLRVKLLDEPINGILPNESLWDWTLLVAFINSSRNEAELESVSREVNFKRDGWYREHVFKVPYDSQPVFFLYPKTKYRKKIQKFLSKNFGEIQKIGEKTLEIAGAYAQIGLFLNELQSVISANPYGYGSYYGYSGYNGYYGYGSGSPFGPDFIQNQLIERLAQSFNITLPSCWNGGTNYAQSNDFVSRAQCVAKNVKLEDFDLNVSRILQQGGLLAATKLVEKYPQLAYWINVAAAAADLILKIMKKTPLKIVPTMARSANTLQNRNGQYNQYSQYNSGYISPNMSQELSSIPPPDKISLFAETPPTDSDFVSAFPIVLHKWQAEPDPEHIILPVPSLMEPCLHVGQNILKNTDLSFDWLRDQFSRDFKLVLSAGNGFSKEFPLIKNLGLSGWMLNITPQDIESFPKVRMDLEARITATRGFSRIESEKFSIPISGGGEWEIAAESQREFDIGGRRRIVIKNTLGNCRCLQSITYKPSFGGEFTFVAGNSSNPLRFTENGNEAWFEIDTTHFRPGPGNLELRAFGNNLQPHNIAVNLFPGPPRITKLTVHRGDREFTFDGENVGQITSVSINGKTALPVAGSGGVGANIKTFAFRDPGDLILQRNVLIEMELEGNRRYKYPEEFPVLPSRPAIESDSRKELEAETIETDDAEKMGELSEYPVLPAETKVLTVPVKTSITDYGFQTENISIETKIENAQGLQSPFVQTGFEVLDSLNMRIVFNLSDNDRQMLAGRRLQFRIKDTKRGESDWYTIRQTFVRRPKIDSVNCRNEACTISGEGLDYIGQISTDGGISWQAPGQVQISQNGKAQMTIENVSSKELLKYRLRDFSETRPLSFK